MKTIERETFTREQWLSLEMYAHGVCYALEHMTTIMTYLSVLGIGFDDKLREALQLDLVLDGLECIRTTGYLWAEGREPVTLPSDEFLLLVNTLMSSHEEKRRRPLSPEVYD